MLPSPRFGLRSLLAFVAVCAIVLWIVPAWMRRHALTRLNSAVAAAPPSSGYLPDFQSIDAAADDVRFAHAGPDAARMLAGLLTSPDRKVRMNAAIALSEIGPAAEVAMVPLITALNDGPGVASYAADALGRLGPVARPAVPRLTEVVANDRESLIFRHQAALALVRIGEVRPLFEVLRDGPDPWAFHALIEAGPSAKAATPILLDYLNDAKPEVRLLGIRTLGYVGEESRAVEDALGDCVDDPDPEIVSAARAALAKLRARQRAGSGRE